MRATLWIRLWASTTAFAAILDGVRLDAPFLYDDVHAIHEQAWIRGERPTREEIGYPLGRFPVLASQRADLVAHGIRRGDPVPRPLRIGQWMWQGLDAALVARIAMLLPGGSAAAGALAAALFVAHPAQAESVSYLTGRAELVSCALALGCVLLDGSRRLAARAAAPAAVLLALLAKPHVVSLPLLAWIWRRGRGRRPSAFPWVAAAIVAAGATWVLHEGMLRDPEPWTDRLVRQTSILPSAWGRYAAWTLWPSAHAVHDILAPSSPVLGGILVAALAGVVLSIACGPRPSPALSGIGWAIAALLPTASLAPLNEAVAEHRLHLPLAGLCAAAGIAGARRGRWHPAACAVLVLFAAGHAARARAWGDARRFWSAETLQRPTYSGAQFSLAAAWMTPGETHEDLTRAGAALDHSLRTDPFVQEALQNRAYWLLRTGRAGEAAALARDLTAHPAATPRTRLRAARVLEDAVRGGLAETRRRLAAAADDIDLLNHEAHLLDLAGDPAAEGAFRTVLDRQPDSARAHHNLGTYLAVRGRPTEAEPHLRRAVQIDPAYARAWAHLGNCLRLLDRDAEALECLLHAVRADPTLLIGWNNLTGLHLAAGRFPEAREANRNALAVAPGDHAARTYLLQIDALAAGR